VFTFTFWFVVIKSLHYYIVLLFTLSSAAGRLPAVWNSTQSPSVARKQLHHPLSFTLAKKLTNRDKLAKSAHLSLVS